MLKMILCDGDGTLGLPSPSQEIINLIQTVKNNDIILGVTSNGNKRIIRRQLGKAGIKVNFIITPKDVGGAKKPSPELIFKAQDYTSLNTEEIIYLGDDDNTDILSAINANVLPFNALYSTSNKPKEYGIPLDSPIELSEYIKLFGLQDPPYFGWSAIIPRINVNIRCLIHNHRHKTETLKRVLKKGRDETVGKKKIKVKIILFYYLISQCYFSGIMNDQSYMAIYPGHRKNRKNVLLKQYSVVWSKLFNQKFDEDLLVRHKNAPESKSQKNRKIIDQLNTIHVNPDYKDKIKNKNIVVLDDFTTSGNSLETARQMLLKAGAKKVYGIAIAKYRRRSNIIEVDEDWDPFQPHTFSKSSISKKRTRGKIHKNADEHFHDNIWRYYKNL